MKPYNLFFVFLFAALLFVSCRKEDKHYNQNASLDDYAQLDTAAFRLNSHRIREHIYLLARQDTDSLPADYRTRSYYRNRGNFLWIDRQGLDSRADTLLAWLDKLSEIGFSKTKFRAQIISRDLHAVRTLAVDNNRDELNKVMARLEYNLTKAFLRYVSGQRFGFVNPTQLLNNLDLDVRDEDSTNVFYRGLFDVEMENATKKFYSAALRKIYNDSVSAFLNEVQPSNELYRQYLANFKKSSGSATEKIILLCNLERSRWRQADNPTRHRKYVLVNIPSFHLDAIDGDSILTMRMACGNVSTKTPLLTSRIMRMDINPQWIIPRSIIRKDIVQHAGNRDYFEKRRYFVRERKSSKRIDLENVTSGMLLSPDYFVIQEGGEGNALGRIIFRFNNNFSIFIHDTSSKEAFARDNRGVSHGCIRVQKPFDLAVFMLEDKDPTLIEKIRYSMEADLYRSDEDKEKNDINKEKLVRSLKVKPEIPVFITYYTLYPDKQGIMQSYPDVYGYDKVIYAYLKNYIE